jgi:hypothetical protein
MPKISVKNEKISSDFFQTSKTICDDYGQKVKKTVFFKTFFGFSILDIYKCPIFDSLFTFWN